MTNRFIKFGFVSGVLAPGYRNRSDLEKYDLALEEGKNWFIDYRGGIVSRPGSLFVDFIRHDDNNVLLAPFQYGFDLANTYMVVFGHNYVRFLQDGAYVLEAAKTVTTVTSTTVTSAAHGFSNGDWVVIQGFDDPSIEALTCIVRNKTTNTFTLETVFGNTVDLSDSSSGGTVARVYTVTTTITSAQVPTIRTHQIRDTLRITSVTGAFFPFDLVRTNSTSWSIAPMVIENTVDIPTGLSVTGPGGSAGVMYTVTAVSSSGEESLPAEPFILNGVVNFSVTSGYAKLTWDAQDNVSHFNVYRSIIVSAGDKLTRAQQMGFLGRAYGPSFTDNNIIPDFAVSPPKANNPFADASIQFINVTAGGSGYTNASTVTVTDGTGSGFVGFPVVDLDTGEVLAIVVVNGGEGYSSPSVSVSVGTGATFDVELSSSSGNNPRIGCLFQQREVLISTPNNPMTVYGSRPGLFNNFDVSDLVLENDSYEFEVDSPVVVEIKSVLPTRAGLLLLSPLGMWQLVGSGGGAVTPTDALIERQSYNGVSDIGPLQINEDIIILDAEGTTVRSLSYSDYSKTYQSVDISILSNHYFTQANPTVSWEYFNSPHRLIHAIRSDGTMVVGCVVKEHQMFAWSDWETKGFYRQVAKLREGNLDRVYMVVERYVNGAFHKFLEVQAPRTFEAVEDLCCLDSALVLAKTSPDEDVMPSGITGTITLTADSAIFSTADYNKVFSGGGGRGRVTAFVSPTQLTIELDRDITHTVHGTNRPYKLLSGQWSLDTPQTTVYGLWHLEGETVNALVDGHAHLELTVENGSVTFPEPFVRAAVGLGYTATGKALMPAVQSDVLEDSMKRTTAIAVWQNESRGLRLGTNRTKLYEVKERTTELMDRPPELQTGMSLVYVDPLWHVEGTFYFEQRYPLPSSLLGWVAHHEFGDDDDRN